MSIEANKAIVRRYQEAYNANQLDALDELVAADIITPQRLPGFPDGLAGLKQLHQMTLEAWPDLHTSLDRLIADGDWVVAHLTLTATPVKAAFGVPATGRSFKIRGIFAVRIAGGKIVEHRGWEDALGIMQQLTSGSAGG